VYSCSICVKTCPIGAIVWGEQKMHYDAVIVGQRTCRECDRTVAAETGAKVLIIERRAEVGVPVLCGEGISQKVDTYKVWGETLDSDQDAGGADFSPN